MHVLPPGDTRKIFRFSVCAPEKPPTVSPVCGSTTTALLHVFCTTALSAWKLDATDVSRMAGHANYRITLDMYVGATAGVLARARTATAGL